MDTHDFLIQISIPMSLLTELADHTGESFYGDKCREFICTTTRREMAAQKAHLEQAAAHSHTRGYQWKRLFLPDGTMLRAQYRNLTRYAVVENESILADGRAVSPSQFANTDGCGNRNAWESIWLLLPGAGNWMLARDCRPQVAHQAGA